ncbi:hypothetical protein D3C77_504390 [compost metagenome]
MEYTSVNERTKQAVIKSGRNFVVALTAEEFQISFPKLSRLTIEIESVLAGYDVSHEYQPRKDAPMFHLFDTTQLLFDEIEAATDFNSAMLAIKKTTDEIEQISLICIDNAGLGPLEMSIFKKFHISLWESMEQHVGTAVKNWLIKEKRLMRSAIPRWLL